MAKEIFCAFGVDVDAVAGWLGSYGGEDSPCDISRGMFGGEVGSMRLLRLFERWGIKTTWFVPGHSIETFPAQMKAVADAGHEIGMHGYSHENPVAMTPEQEEAIFDKCIEVIEACSGNRPARLRCPVVGVRVQDQRAAAEEGHQVRPLADARRFHALLCAGR
jgi:peptidoglycan/xylan/chitin deacetylase (PgdA/CDA1 family)